MLALYKDVIHLPIAETPTSTRITKDPKYITYFSDCISALNSIYIDVQVAPQEQPRYRNHKSYLTQNILTIYDFDLRFYYILLGQEGSVHDIVVWRDAQYYKGFKTLSEKYQLGDVGYANTDTILVLYRGIRYYLKEQRLSSQKPMNYKELFNLRYTSLRNIIERIFGILKRKYQILRCAPEYSFETQTRIIIACCILHNFVRLIEGEAIDTLLATESQEPLEDL